MDDSKMEDRVFKAAVFGKIAGPPQSEFQKQVDAERKRQIEDLGYTAEHDDAHGADRLLHMAKEHEVRGEYVQATALRRAADDVIKRRKARQPRNGADI